MRRFDLVDLIVMIRVTLSPDHWSMLAECLSKDDHSIKHLTLNNIHVTDENVERFAQVSALLESVWLSGVGVGGDWSTYSEYPDMKMSVWSALASSLISHHSRYHIFKYFRPLCIKLLLSTQSKYFAGKMFYILPSKHICVYINLHKSVCCQGEEAKVEHDGQCECGEECGHGG